MSLYPQQTTNPNVPEDVFLVAEVRTYSEGVTTVYFIDLEGNCRRVSGWASSGTRSVFPYELCRLTGDTWKMILARYDSWKRQREEEGT